MPHYVHSGEWDKSNDKQKVIGLARSISLTVMVRTKRGWMSRFSVKAALAIIRLVVLLAFINFVPDRGFL
jgi:hypothetical protein